MTMLLSLVSVMWVLLFGPELMPLCSCSIISFINIARTPQFKFYRKGASAFYGRDGKCAIIDWDAPLYYPDASSRICNAVSFGVVPRYIVKTFSTSIPEKDKIWEVVYDSKSGVGTIKRRPSEKKRSIFLSFVEITPMEYDDPRMVYMLTNLPGACIFYDEVVKIAHQLWRIGINSVYIPEIIDRKNNLRLLGKGDMGFILTNYDSPQLTDFADDLEVPRFAMSVIPRIGSEEDQAEIPLFVYRRWDLGLKYFLCKSVRRYIRDTEFLRSFFHAINHDSLSSSASPDKTSSNSCSSDVFLFGGGRRRNRHRHYGRSSAAREKFPIKLPNGYDKYVISKKIWASIISDNLRDLVLSHPALPRFVEGFRVEESVFRSDAINQSNREWIDWNVRSTEDIYECDLYCGVSGKGVYTNSGDDIDARNSGWARFSLRRILAGSKETEFKEFVVRTRDRDVIRAMRAYNDRTITRLDCIPLILRRPFFLDMIDNTIRLCLGKSPDAYHIAMRHDGTGIVKYFQMIYITFGRRVIGVEFSTSSLNSDTKGFSIRNVVTYNSLSEVIEGDGDVKMYKVNLKWLTVA